MIQLEKECRMEKYLQEKYIRLYKLIGTSIVVYIVFRTILPLFVPFLVAWCLTCLIYPVAVFLHRKVKLPISIGGSISLVIFLIVLGSSLFFLGRLLLAQITDFATNYTSYQQIVEGYAQQVCRYCDKTFHVQIGSTYAMLENGMLRVADTIQEDLLPTLTKKSFQVATSVATGIAGILITFIATLLWIKDKEECIEAYHKFAFYEEISRVMKRLSKTGIAYLKTQGILFLLVATCCTVGLLCIRNKYALLLGILIAIFDFLPVFGSGLFFLPWAIFCLLSGQIFQSAILITTYVLCMIIREFLEPKLLGDKIGLKPVVMLMAIYVGMKLFGLWGFLLGPVGLILILAICE